MILIVILKNIQKTTVKGFSKNSRSKLNFVPIKYISAHPTEKLIIWNPSEKCYKPLYCKTGALVLYYSTRGRILGRNWDKSLKSFPPCYSQSPLQMDLPPPPPTPQEQKWFETGL